MNRAAGLRVVFVIGSFWPEIGGLQRSTERLAVQLVKLGHEVNVVTQLGHGAKALERRSGLLIHRYAAGRGFTSLAAHAGRFRGADVICVFGVGSDPTAAWWRPVLDAHAALHTVRLLKPGTDGDITRAGIPAPMYRQFHGVLCQTDHIAAEAQRVGIPSASCFPVRNGLDLQGWRRALPSQPVARRQLGLGEATFVVLGLGRFIRRKRFPDLLRSLAGFVSRTPPQPGRSLPVLLLHGSGFAHGESEEAELRRLAGQLIPSVDVRFVPPTVDPRVTLAASDVLAVLSEREGAPNVLIEGFAAGRPVIATDLVGHRVYIHPGQEGLLVPVGDIDAVAASLRLLFDEPTLRREMGRAAELGAARFDVSSTASDYLRAFTAARHRQAHSLPRSFREPGGGQLRDHQAVHAGDLDRARHGP